MARNKKKQKEFFGEELTIAETIRRLRRNLLVHSCIYYHLDKNIISDFQYDSIAKELVKLQKEYPDIAKEIEFHKDFEQFGVDGCYSGYNLPYTLPEVRTKAEYIVEKHENGWK